VKLPVTLYPIFGMTADAMQVAQNLETRRNAIAAEEPAAASQRRYVTVLFSDVTGSSEHAERLEAEDYADLLAQFRRIARETLARHGGCVARLQGDGLLALFGHPVASEDDGRRATEAALELHARVAQLSVGTGSASLPMQLHSGIHAGLALLTEGDIERGRFDVVGEVANTASRLCGLAMGGQIMVSAETLGPQAHFFEAQSLGLVLVKGRTTPLSVLQINGQAAFARRIDAAAQRGVVPFVGRVSALAQLKATADQARAGQGCVRLVLGEAGIGKTRLIDEFQRHLDPTFFQVLQGYCEKYLGAEPLQPFVQWLRSVLDWHTGASGEQNQRRMMAALSSLGIAHIADFTPLVQALAGTQTKESDLPPPAVRVSAVIDIVAALSAQRTLVLILDDWQWADDASRHLLQALITKQLPIFILIAARPTDQDNYGLIGVPTVLVQPLPYSESVGTISAWLPLAEPFITQEIYRQSGGSPLFIEELCHATSEGQVQSATPTTPAAWINSLVASRLGRLPADQVDFLHIAAVVGNVFATWVLERLTSPDQTAVMLQALSAQDFLVPADPSGMLRFKHVLTRDAVYLTVSPTRRRALHLEVAQLLQSSGPSLESMESLAYHYEAAHAYAPAAKFAEAAGDKAMAAMALDRSRAHYSAALDALDALPEQTHEMVQRWCAVAEKLGQACVFDPLDLKHGLALFERATQKAAELGNANAQARSHYWLGYVNYAKGRPRWAIHHCQAALDHATLAGDLRLIAQVKATLGQAYSSAGIYHRALPLLAQAVQSKRQQSRIGSSTAVGSAYSLARMAYSYADRGEFQRAHELFQEALHLVGDKFHPVAASVRQLMCAARLWQGRWTEAVLLGTEGADIALRCSSRYATAMGRALAACAAWARDRDGASLGQLRESTYWIQARGGAVSTSLNYGWLVEAALSVGLVDEARQHAAQLFARARTQDKHGLAQGCRALAKWFASQGREARAQHYLEIAQNVAEFRQSPREAAHNVFCHSEILFELKQHPRAVNLARDADQAFTLLQMPWYGQRCQELLARIGASP
jgi:class 3 adenylate cyclase/tetratricopeptide (TPR) repeat protein